MTVNLYAGQDILVGYVTVTNDYETIYIEYQLNEGWCMTETHVHVGEELGDFPLAGRWGNPVPGQFDYKNDHDPCVISYTYEIPIGDWEADDTVLIGAHAVVEKVECEILAVAPYGGFEIVDTFQAWRIDHTPEAPRYVREQRSNPDNVLEIGTPGQETFYSLGYGGVLNSEGTAVETFFGEYFEDRRDPAAIREMEEWVDDDLAAELSDTENNAGWIIIEFDYPILNVEGEYDLQVVEDTWGLPYPLELAAVFGRADANDDWTFLFLAHNQEPVGTPTYHTYTNGNLGDLDQAVQILVQDVSDPEWFIPYPHGVATLDGYDLNAVVALNDHEVCTVYDETAWGAFDVGDKRFTEQGNWATYFTYIIGQQEYILDIVSVNNNTGFTHEFTIRYNPNDGTISGTGDSEHAGKQTLSEFEFDLDEDGIISYIKFRSDYDATAYFWFPAFNLKDDGSLEFVDIEGDNVFDAKGTWEINWVF